ncbi:MAG: hypothetical protein PVSMB8_00170 [Vulcanimicrobiaceae bacterium]
MDQSNAQLSKAAKEASAKAEDACGGVKKNDEDSQREAARSHNEASYKNRNAGNSTEADKHATCAKSHSAQAELLAIPRRAAENLGRLADQHSKNAELKDYGATKSSEHEYDSPKKDTRSAEELHGLAADAHDKASEAFKVAGNTAASNYHADKAATHKGKVKAS